jgi:hypothetical protein
LCSVDDRVSFDVITGIQTRPAKSYRSRSRKAQAAQGEAGRDGRRIVYIDYVTGQLKNGLSQFFQSSMD